MRPACTQQGLVSLAGLGWILWAVCVGLLVLKVAPGMGEHARVRAMVQGIAGASLSDAQAVQQAFDARREINRVESLAGRDLVVTRENGVLVISYAYDHKIEILDRVTLLVRYEGSTRGATQ